MLAADVSDDECADDTMQAFLVSLQKRRLEAGQSKKSASEGSAGGLASRGGRVMDPEA